MIKDGNNTAIQAMPIYGSTFVGTASALDVNNKSVVHCNADTDLTFAFASGDVVVSALAGADFAIGVGCTTITSTAEVIVS